jgi:hypothetical protein
MILKKEINPLFERWAEHGRVGLWWRAETLQDLLRFLRRDTTRERPVMMQLHAWNLVEKDLLPLIRTYHSETDPSILEPSEPVSYTLAP